MKPEKIKKSPQKVELDDEEDEDDDAGKKIIKIIITKILVTFTDKVWPLFWNVSSDVEFVFATDVIITCVNEYKVRKYDFFCILF